MRFLSRHRAKFVDLTPQPPSLAGKGEPAAFWQGGGASGLLADERFRLTCPASQNPLRDSPRNGSEKPLCGNVQR